MRIGTLFCSLAYATAAFAVSIPPQQLLDGNHASPKLVFDNASSNNTFGASQWKSPVGVIDDNPYQWSGYLDLGDDKGKKLFFWVFGSRNNPAEDPVILWLNGGPGTSSLYGAFCQWGPKLWKETWKNNDHTLVEKATMIFLEQPIGVGFTKWNSGESVSSTPKATEYTVAFLDAFFQTKFFDKAPFSFSTENFHIAGQSFAGHFIPNIAKEIAVTSKLKPKSIIIGSAFVDYMAIPGEMFKMACDQNFRPNEAVELSGKQCEELDALAKACKAAIENCQSSNQCNLEQNCNRLAPKYREFSRRDPYDVSKEEHKCDLEKFFKDNTDVWERIWAYPSALEWKSYNNEMAISFQEKGDYTKSYAEDIKTVLKHDIRVLLYAVRSTFPRYLVKHC